MESYLLRIYQIEKDNPRTLVGLVEKIGDKKRMGFASLDELWEILNSYAPMNWQIQSPVEKNEIHLLSGCQKSMGGEKKAQKKRHASQKNNNRKLRIFEISLP